MFHLCEVGPPPAPHCLSYQSMYSPPSPKRGFGLGSLEVDLSSPAGPHPKRGQRKQVAQSRSGDTVPSPAPKPSVAPDVLQVSPTSPGLSGPLERDPSLRMSSFPIFLCPPLQPGLPPHSPPTHPHPQPPCTSSEQAHHTGPPPARLTQAVPAALKAGLSPCGAGERKGWPEQRLPM